MGTKVNRSNIYLSPKVSLGGARYMMAKRLTQLIQFQHKSLEVCLTSFPAFIARVGPASNSANSACMKKTVERGDQDHSY